MNFLHALSEIRNFGLDIFFTICTTFGEEVVLMGLFAICFWCINKKLAYKMTFAFFTSGVIVQGLKLHFRIERPWIIDPGFTPVESAIEGASGYSFPSGHTQSSASIYGVLAFHSKRIRYAIILFVIIGLVMLSRMYLGVHTPADVLTSFAITTIIAFVIDFVFDNLNSTRFTDICILALIELAGIGLIYYFYTLVSSGTTTSELAMDGFKSVGAFLGFGIAWFIEKNYINFNPKSDGLIAQLLKLVIGLAVTIALKSGLKVLFGDNMLGNTVRYFVIVLWVIAIFPAIIKAFSRSRNY